MAGTTTLEQCIEFMVLLDDRFEGVEQLAGFLLLTTSFNGIETFITGGILFVTDETCKIVN